MTSDAGDSVTTPKIDCDVHNTIPSLDVLLPYLSDHWRDYITERGITNLEPNYYPHGLSFSAAPQSRPTSGDPPGSDVDLLREQVLDHDDVRYAILNCLYGIQQIHNEDWATEMATALNRWQADHWLTSDTRLRASIVVPPQSPSAAAEEIERWATHPGFVQVLLLARSGAPYGKRFYWPIYAAAERNGLPIGIHVGGATINPITPAGWPSYYIEDYGAAAQAFQTQLVSLVCEGVFSQFQLIRLVLIESGVTWLPALMWRLDKNWKGLRREIPWVDRLPSAIIRDHVSLSVQPFDGPADAHTVRKLVEHIGDEQMLLFATDYPHAHARSAVDSCIGYLDPEKQRRVYHDNGCAVYGLE